MNERSPQTQILLRYEIPILPCVNDANVYFFGSRVYSHKHLVDFVLIGKPEGVID